MEFPLIDLTAMNGSEVAAGQRGSLFSRQPVVAVPYVAVLAVAAVVGTFGNLVVVITVIIQYARSRRQRAGITGRDAGRAFIANLALSDMIVTALINPLAIAGRLCLWLELTQRICRSYNTYLIKRPPLELFFNTLFV